MSVGRRFIIARPSIEQRQTPTVLRFRGDGSPFDQGRRRSSKRVRVWVNLMCPTELFLFIEKSEKSVSCGKVSTFEPKAE